MSLSIEDQIQTRSVDTGLPDALLRAVYLREARESSRGGTALTAAALMRVDQFICYALTRDTRYPRDRDLAPSASALSS